MTRLHGLLASSSILAIAFAGAAAAQVSVQCPADAEKMSPDALADFDISADEVPTADRVCQHLAAGDGFATMADGTRQYTFGYHDVTHVPDENVLDEGILAANWAAPSVVTRQNQEMYLTLTNVGLIMRPDLFDPHTVHYHGFANAATVFDGEPEAGVSINPQASFTYYYNFTEPGTYMYHCHVEAAEHMQMGMLGSAYVLPAQDLLSDGTVLGGHTHSTGDTYTYNDGDGSTFYDVDYPIQLGSFDFEFHDEHIMVQPLPFYTMNPDYPMINGRGYPDTVLMAEMSTDVPEVPTVPTRATQKQPSLVKATQGDRVLLRVSNLDVTAFHTLQSDLPLRVVGRGAKISRGWGEPDGNAHGIETIGKDFTFDTYSLTLGGGESADVIIDTGGVATGTYFLRTANLHLLSNYREDLGGMMTEIVIE